MSFRRLAAASLAAMLIVGFARIADAQDDPPSESDRGAYLAAVAGCAHCHSPADGPSFSGNSFSRNNIDYYAPNLTPSSSGLGGWSADDIATVITTGIKPDGSQLSPVMPYLYFNRMADSDVVALVDYLQSLAPVETAPPPPQTHSELPPAPQRQTGITAPDSTDLVAYGEYLTDAVLACGSCHTPVQANGLPDRDLYLAGGTAFTGEWGTVYAGNLTPQPTDGLAPLSDEAIILAIVAGQHPDRRPVYAMTWEAYDALTGHDVQAVVDYLRSIPPVFSQTPLADLNPGYDMYPQGQRETPTLLNILITVGILGVLAALIVILSIRQWRQAQRMRTTDWEGHFRDVLAQARDEQKSGSPRSDEE